MRLSIDTGIINTMTNENFLAEGLLAGKGISLLDAVRLICNALDAKPSGCGLTDVQFCSNIIETGKRHIRKVEMSIRGGFTLYLETKKHLRAESLRDIRYLGDRLLKGNSDFAKSNFSELSALDCEKQLSQTFTTPSQFNKARTMLHGLFEFALRREWCEKNVIKLIERKKVVEKEIKPLTISQTTRLLKTARSKPYSDCSAAVGLLTLAGIRPREVRRLRWRDIDLDESFITVRSLCSKTGGIRHVEICPALKKFLRESENEPDSHICPPNWNRRWRRIRNDSGFKGIWTQDVLRHTYASYHAKCFRDLPRLQLNMGHRDQSLLRSRYVNMGNITRADAQRFFSVSGN